MKQFFKFSLSSILGSIIGGIIVFFIVFGFITGTFVSSLQEAGKKQTYAVKDSTVLRISFNEAIVDRTPVDELDILAELQDEPKKIGLNDITRAIREAATDSRIEGIFMDFSGVSGGMASLDEVHDALLEFKASDKWMLAYSETYSQGGYYLASTADEVYMYPEGGMDFRGLGGELYFLKDFFDKTGLQMQVIRGSNNRFKSAVEPYLTNAMSDANREQTMTYLSAIWNHMLTGISEQRGVSVEELNMMADSMYIRNPQDAIEYKLIDGVKYSDEIDAMLKEKVGLGEDDKVEFMALSKYINARPEKTEENEDEEATENDQKIAVVYAIGGIESGQGDDATIGSARIAKAIREARKDSTIDAIVLRVNSPGGSALASDVIWREVMLAREAKPFVVSMGNLAASGGYYISCAAHKIYASRVTITGSIGVFGVIPNVGDALKEHMGINFDRVETNKFATMGSMYHALSDEEYKIIQEGVDEVYMTFKSRVADGRGMTVDEVDSIGQGRVWAGIDAKEIGLVDEFGGLKEAIAGAAELAELGDNYEVVNFPKRKSKLEEILEEMQKEAEAQQAETMLGEFAWIYNEINNLKNMRGIQMRLPFIMHIH